MYAPRPPISTRQCELGYYFNKLNLQIIIFLGKILHRACMTLCKSSSRRAASSTWPTSMQLQWLDCRIQAFIFHSQLFSQFWGMSGGNFLEINFRDSNLGFQTQEGHLTSNTKKSSFIGHYRASNQTLINSLPLNYEVVG